MRRGVGGATKSLYQSYKRPAFFKSGQWHFHQDNAPVYTPILVTYYFTKMGIKTVPHPLYSPDLAPCDPLFNP